MPIHSAKTSTASATAAENTRVTEAAAAQTRAAGKSRIPRLKATFSGAARRSDRLSHRNNIAAKAESVEPDHAIRSNDNEEIEPVFDYRGNEGTAQPYRRSPRAPSVDLVGLMNRMHTSTDSTDTGSGEFLQLFQNDQQGTRSNAFHIRLDSNSLYTQLV